MAQLAVLVDGQPAAVALVAASTVRYDAGGSSGDGLTDRVDFGDGTLVSQPSETHVYGAPGAYSVTLTVTDQTGHGNRIAARGREVSGGHHLVLRRVQPSVGSV